MKSVALKTALKRDYLIRAASSSHGNILHTVQSSAHMLGCILVSGYLVPFLLAVAAAARQSDRVLMGKRVTRESFVKVDRSSGADDHEVVIGVKQNGLVELDNLLMKLSDPMSSRYQKWLSFDEVTAITANPEGTQAVLDWLSHYGITATRQTVRGDYITAVAPLSTWEEALSTTFHKFADLSPHSPALAQNTFIHRADEYSLPSSMHAHIAAVFNTVQSPPELSGRHPGTRSGVSIDLRGREVQQKSLRSTVRRLYNDDVVTVSFLNDLYGIGTNTGDPTQRQAVFETNYQMFSQDDLRAFQSHFDLPTQPALDPYGYSTTDCVAHSCHEANLDLQYMMGVAQGTQTICWYQGGGDPFVDFVTAVANSTHPPLVNSISWGAVEQVS
jgi:subtilase family serine protease